MALLLFLFLPLLHRLLYLLVSLLTSGGITLFLSSTSRCLLFVLCLLKSAKLSYLRYACKLTLKLLPAILNWRSYRAKVKLVYMHYQRLFVHFLLIRICILRINSRSESEAWSELRTFIEYRCGLNHEKEKLCRWHQCNWMYSILSFIICLSLLCFHLLVIWSCVLCVFFVIHTVYVGLVQQYSLCCLRKKKNSLTFQGWCLFPYVLLQRKTGERLKPVCIVPVEGNTICISAPLRPTNYHIMCENKSVSLRVMCHIFTNCRHASWLWQLCNLL